MNKFISIIIAVPVLVLSVNVNGLLTENVSPIEELGLVNRSQLNIKGNVKSISISRLEFFNRNNKDFVKTRPSLLYNFKQSGDLISMSKTSGDFITKWEFIYSNNKLTKIIETKESVLKLEIPDKKLVRKLFYKNDAIIGTSLKGDFSLGCSKLSHSKNTITFKFCGSAETRQVTYDDNFRITSRTIKSDLLPFLRDVYTYTDYEIIKKSFKEEKLISTSYTKLDKDSNIIERNLIFDNESLVKPIIGNAIKSGRTTYEISEYDKFRNPLKALHTSLQTEQNKEEAIKFKIHEYLTYEYY